MSDRVGHQITNDDNARHVVTTLLPGLSQGQRRDTRLSTSY
jgi:hypothetical protein